MARKCLISGKSNQQGHRVSHAKNRRKHTFKANLQTRRIFLPEENRHVKVRISTRMIRTIDKLGLDAALKQFNMKMADIVS
jgi:large subunit ribosomal protein L28